VRSCGPGKRLWQDNKCHLSFRKSMPFRGAEGDHVDNVGNLEPIPKGVRTLACPLRGKDLRRELRGPGPFWDRLLFLCDACAILQAIQNKIRAFRR
jgi:hypothetical protein